MRRTVAILTLVALMSLHGTSAVWGGGAILTQPTKTVGPAVNFSAVVVVFDGNISSTKGQSALRVQKSSKFDGALFTSNYVKGFGYTCNLPGASLEVSTDTRFIGFMNGWVPADVLAQLLNPFGNSSNAAITDINDVNCTTVDNVISLSFTGTIQFQP